jgi:hypothetical protein
MYHILIFIQLFFKFVVQKLNSKMVKYGMIILTGREKTDMTDADVIVDCML